MFCVINITYMNKPCFCRSEKLLTLTRGLSPFYLRFGGTSADFLTFVNDTGSCKYGPIRKEAFQKDWIQDEMDWLQDNHKNYTNYTMSGICLK